MDIRELRGLKILLPYDDPDTRTPADTPSGSDLDDLTVSAVDWSGQRLRDRLISRCSFTTACLASTEVTEARITNCTFTDTDLSSTRWTGIRLDRTTFTGCKLLGAHLDQITAEDVIFERCRLDYATLNNWRATNNVAFIDCSLHDATLQNCKLDNAVFADCPMPNTSFLNSTLRGADLRGSDLSTITGTASLSGVRIDDEQLQPLTMAMLADLDIRIDKPAE